MKPPQLPLGVTLKSLCTFVKPLESFVVKILVIEPQRFSKDTQSFTKNKLIKVYFLVSPVLGMRCSGHLFTMILRTNWLPALRKMTVYNP